MMSDRKVRVLIVDDSAFMRNVLTRMIESNPQFEIVGKAVNGREAIEMVAQLKPDVVTMDIEMPEMNGLQALQYIMSSTPTPVVMVSSLTESGTEATLKALELGAVDFIPKALNDAEKNIFRSAGNVHSRLLTAAAAKVSARAGSNAAVQVPQQQAVRKDSQPAAPAPTPRATPQPASRPQRFERAKILLIGSSTGGPRALQDVLSGLPGNLRVPVVVVQHMPASFTGPMANRLNDLCPLHVEEVKDGTLIQSGHIYVCPGGMQARVQKTDKGLMVKVQPDEGESLFKPSVEVMGQSVADALGGDVLAVMLTGMGSDGNKAFKRLRDAGAYVIAQDQATSVVYGMPKAVVDNGAAHEALPLGDIAAVISKLLS
ncbi:MAG: chemotaxis-specific protein-glutamate methyltransferase CheB [Proteobacteria bacterium]|nr:chemotaxis-specific protein-glutamate methyltransferase CheB [Pseudomonadota bacterium]